MSDPSPSCLVPGPAVPNVRIPARPPAGPTVSEMSDSGRAQHGTWSRPTSPYDRVATVRATPSQMALRGALVGRLTEGPADPPRPVSRRQRARRRDAAQ